jgi:NADPH-dependent 2,4-dienoyl-CoA reductase/sulfur reductase-like enzyme
LAIPAAECHVEEGYDEQETLNEDLPFIYPPSFEDENIEEKVQTLISSMGVRIVKNAKIIEIIEDKDEGLEAVLFKMLDIPDEVEDDDEIEGLD